MGPVVLCARCESLRLRIAKYPEPQINIAFEKRRLRDMFARYRGTGTVGKCRRAYS